MKPRRRAVQVLIAAILTIFLIVVVYSFIPNQKKENVSIFDLPAPNIPTESNELPFSVTQLAEAQVSIPTIEIEYIYTRDIDKLQEYLNENAKNWLNMSLNVHSTETFGVATSAEKVENVACGGNTLDDFLCRYAVIEYTSVYKGVLTGGVNSDFVLKPTLSLKEDWTEVERITTDNKITFVMGSTAIITFTGYTCVTSVEENSPSPIAEGEVPPTDRSYTLKTLDERRLWPDLGPYIFPTGINEESLKIDAERKAKAKALELEKIISLLQTVQNDMQLNGPFVSDISTFYNQETAQIFGVKGFEFVINLTAGDPNIRCDGTPVLK